MKMFKNKKGQKIFAGIMIGVMVLVVIVQLIKPMKDQITDARDTDNLNCSSSDITTMRQASCIVVDSTLFYFVGMAIAAAGAFFGGKMIKDSFTE